MRRSRFYRVFRALVISVPIFLLVCTVILPFIPGSLGMFSDRASPWYQGVTAPLFLGGLIYAYPVTFLCTHFVSDDMFLSPGYFVVLAVYTTAWVTLLRTIFWFCERRAKQAT